MIPLLMQDWKPILSVNLIVFALELFLCDPPDNLMPGRSSIEIHAMYQNILRGQIPCTDHI